VVVQVVVIRKKGKNRTRTTNQDELLLQFRGNKDTDDDTMDEHFRADGLLSFIA
jgi:hypothetical protein